MNTILKPVLKLYTNGGPDHRLTYGTVQVALIAMFKHLQLDYLVAARTCPGQSYKNPVERIMSLINLALQCIGLMREEMSQDMEAEMRKAKSTSDIRKAGKKNKHLKSSLAQSVGPTKSLVEEFVSRVRLHEQPFSVQPAATEEEMDEMWSTLESIDSTLERSDTKKSQLKDKAGLQSFLQHCCISRNYFFTISKCGDQTCTICGPSTLPPDLLKELHHFPDPVLATDKEHYKPFADVWGTATTEEDRPSLSNRGTSENASTKSNPETTTPLVKEKVRSCVHCVGCDKPRCIFSHRALSTDQADSLKAALQDFEFTCGGPLLPEDHQLYRVAVVRQCSCMDDVERVYYSCQRFALVCYKCGSSEPLPIPDELKTTCQSVHPLCAACTAQGNKLRVRKQGKKRKHAATEGADERAGEASD